MKQTKNIIIVGTTLLLAMSSSASVSIANFEDARCPWSDIMNSCVNHPAGVCCEFPGRLTGTASVGFRGLEEDDSARWFNPGQSGTYCGSIRESLVQGRIKGDVCMSVRPGGLHNSNDGANWGRGAGKSHPDPLINIPDPSINSWIGGVRVGSRSVYESLTQDKCVARGYANVLAFEKSENATGVWILGGSAENHKRYLDVEAEHSNLSREEILERAGGTYYDHWENHPHIRALRLGEEVPAHTQRSLIERIRLGEIEENEETLKMARDELQERSSDVRSDPQS